MVVALQQCTVLYQFSLYNSARYCTIVALQQCTIQHGCSPYNSPHYCTTSFRTTTHINVRLQPVKQYTSLYDCIQYKVNTVARLYPVQQCILWYHFSPYNSSHYCTIIARTTVYIIVRLQPVHRCTLYYDSTAYKSVKFRWLDFWTQQFTPKTENLSRSATAPNVNMVGQLGKEM